MSTLVGSKGQVTIQKEIRDRLGVEPGWRAFQRLDGESVVLEFRPPRHQRSLAGILADKVKRTFATEEELGAAIEEAWGIVAHEVANAETVE